MKTGFSHWIYRLALLWLLYFPTVKLFFQWGATPLIDNREDCEKTYLISVYTGVRQNGGTKSRIRFILSGEYRDTGIRRLEDATGKRVRTET